MRVQIQQDEEWPVFRLDPVVFGPVEPYELPAIDVPDELVERYNVVFAAFGPSGTRSSPTPISRIGSSPAVLSSSTGPTPLCRRHLPASPPSRSRSPDE